MYGAGTGLVFELDHAHPVVKLEFHLTIDSRDSRISFLNFQYRVYKKNGKIMGKNTKTL